MKTVINIIKILTICMVLISCEKELKDAKVPEFVKQLVVASFISPSDTMSVIGVSSNKPLFGELYDSLPAGNVTGTISDGETTIPLKKSGNMLYFKNTDMAVEYGKSYYLELMSDEGIRASGNCTVPDYRKFTVTSDTNCVKLRNPFNGQEILSVNMSLQVHDIPGEMNFYRIYAIVNSFYFDETTQKVNEYRSQISFDKEYLSDRGNDGGVITTNTISSMRYFYEMDSAFMTVYLLNTEKSYYQYHTSLLNYEGGENPFTEPSPVYSNLTEGLGIFSSYTADTTVIRLK